MIHDGVLALLFIPMVIASAIIATRAANQESEPGA